MFLHQIFYQGLKARIASWPTLVLGKTALSFAYLCDSQIAPSVSYVLLSVYWSVGSRPLRHPVAHAEHLPGVCEKPPVQSADPGPLQAEPRLRQAAQTVRGQARLWGENPGDLSHLPHVSGQLNCHTVYTRIKGTAVYFWTAHLSSKVFFTAYKYKAV